MIRELDEVVLTYDLPAQKLAAGEIDALLRHAKVDRVERVIRPYLESVA
jgi:hypothetical protein